MDEFRYKNNKSTLLLILAILVAVIITVWVILLFDNQSGDQQKIGQDKGHKIMVAIDKEGVYPPSS